MTLALLLLSLVVLAYLLPLALARLLETRPSSLQSLYQQAVAERSRSGNPGPTLVEADLAGLPPLIQAWMRRIGVVERPRPTGFRVVFKGAMRRAHGAGWLKISVEQHTFLNPPVRLFLMRASLMGIPFVAFHRMVGDSATMQVRVASLIDVVDAKGPEMDRSEAVTFFNDLCLLAPGALLDACVRWEEAGPSAVVGHYTHGIHTVSAALTFNEAGDLVGFSSQDRLQSEDGKTFTSLPWATPIWEHRTFGGVRVAAEAEAIWLEPEGPFPYARFEVQELQAF